MRGVALEADTLHGWLAGSAVSLGFGPAHRNGPSASRGVFPLTS